MQQTDFDTLENKMILVIPTKYRRYFAADKNFAEPEFLGLSTPADFDFEILIATSVYAEVLKLMILPLQQIDPTSIGLKVC